MNYSNDNNKLQCDEYVWGPRLGSTYGIDYRHLSRNEYDTFRLLLCSHPFLSRSNSFYWVETPIVVNTLLKLNSHLTTFLPSKSYYTTLVRYQFTVLGPEEVESLVSFSGGVPLFSSLFRRNLTHPPFWRNRRDLDPSMLNPCPYYSLFDSYSKGTKYPCETCLRLVLWLLRKSTVLSRFCFPGKIHHTLYHLPFHFYVTLSLLGVDLRNFRSDWALTLTNFTCVFDVTYTHQTV